MAKTAPPRPPSAPAPAPRSATPPARPAAAARAATDAGVKVRATALTFYDNARRRPGDVFTISGERIPPDERVPILDKDGVDTGRTKPHRRAGQLRHFNETAMELVDAREPERTTGPQQALDREQHRIAGEKAGTGPGQGSDEDPRNLGVLGE